jgi:hypothetical protein
MTTYRATNTVVATVDDLSRLGAIIQAAVGAGANTAFDLRFSLAHPERLRDRALHQAVESARADAASLADALGGRIESVLEASTTEAAPAVALQSFDSLARTAPPIRPGTVSVSASVELTVELSGATLEAMAPEQPEKPAQLAAATPSAEPATPAQPTGERGAGLGSGGGLAMNPLAQGEDALYGGDAPVAVVASSAAEWHTLADLLPEELEAGPDWDSDVLVGVFLGRRARAGFQVKVERVTQASGGALEVAVSVREPADPSAPMAMTSPYQLVRVAREGLAGSGPYQGEVAILASR